jgi:hypothetical protein
MVTNCLVANEWAQDARGGEGADQKGSVKAMLLKIRCFRRRW